MRRIDIEIYEGCEKVYSLYNRPICARVALGLVYVLIRSCGLNLSGTYIAINKGTGYKKIGYNAFIDYCKTCYEKTK